MRSACMRMPQNILPWQPSNLLNGKGYVTITWSESKGEIIDAIFLEANVGFNGRYTKEGLKLEDGGNYTVCLDCK